jgi:acyl carrier protein
MFPRRLLHKNQPLTAKRSNPLWDDTAGEARDRLLALVVEILTKNSIDRPVSVDDQLTKAGLSSVDMVNLMLAVEAEFDIEIPAADISPENFRSIATIENLIRRILRR